MDKKQALKNQILQLTKQYYEETQNDRKPFVAGESYVNYGGRYYDQAEMVNLVDSALDFWLTAGPWTAKFERQLSSWLGVRYCAVVNSGSSANLLAFAALTAPELGDRAIRRGDEVIAVAAAFPTTVNPILQYGAVPVFLDIDLDTYNIDTSLLEQAYVPGRTKAVFLAHTLGNPFDIKTVKDFCDRHGLWLIEDNCDALGSEYSLDGVTRRTGTWGDIGTSSFYPPHHITMGEGGAVYTDNPLLSRIVRSMRDWGRDCWCDSGVDNTCHRRFTGQYGLLPVGYDHKYVYSHLGYNLKATDMQAAIGCAQLQKIDEITLRRRENHAMLLAGLADVPGITLPVAQPNSNPSWFGFMITVNDDAPFKRNDLTSCLEAHRIQTRNLFAGNIIRHPAFDHLRDIDAYRVVGNLNRTDYVMNHSFWIGVYPGMTPQMLQYMIDTIKNFCTSKYH